MTSTTDTTRLVTFRIGGHLFAAGISSVQRVLRYEQPRSLPDLPEWVDGVVDYQGDVVPVIDMRKRFGLPAETPGPSARLLVCASAGGSAALLVDAVLDVKPVAPADVLDPPALFRGLSGEYLRGLTRRNEDLVVVLDVGTLLTSHAPLQLYPDAR